ncbi:glutathione hydrolase 1 proenzyme [Diachasma alloeum]|uniref:glutathione hydrolase 1 proenzyme n=1 Tax=Diachasma alloeum TaxID=454923 RepID=UPI0010FB3B92|nr:glutathione hydrolase 1 proenzyme [Diachasma alloeum]
MNSLTSSSTSTATFCSEKDSRCYYLPRNLPRRSSDAVAWLIPPESAAELPRTFSAHAPRRRKPRKLILATLLLFVIAVIITTAIFLHFGRRERSHNGGGLTPPDSYDFLPPSWSKLRVFKGGAVCSDGAPCAEIGKGILAKNGSAVDATIATMICNGLVNMQAMGLGGGFMMTIYDRKTQKSYFLVSRDVAPLAARSNMYHNQGVNATNIGPLAISVPGEIAGYSTVHEKFGRLKWEELWAPNIELCDRGWNMTKGLYDDSLEAIDLVRADSTLRKIFIVEGSDELKKPGSLIKPDKLCDTMRILQKKGAKEFYNGTLGKMYIDDLRRQGSILTMEDLNRYRPVWKTTLQTNLSDGTRVFTPNLPSSGALLSFILNVLDEFKFTPDSLKGWNNTILTYHRIIETWKFAYSMRSKMGDDLFVDMREFVKNLTSRDYARSVKAQITDDRTWNDPIHYGAGKELRGDHGTAQISVLAPDGDAASVTSSINMYFGSGIVSEQTGIVSNAGMDDFTVLGRVNYYGVAGTNKNNLIEPLKRPMSSMVPSILVSPSGDVRMVIGGAGGTKITTSVSFTIARHLWMNNTIKEALDASRIHHQVYPMKVAYEYGVPQPVIRGLQNLGHKTSRYRDRGSCVCGLTQINGTVYANADHRKNGDVYGTNEKHILKF